MPRRSDEASRAAVRAGAGSGLLPADPASALAALPRLETAALREEWQRLYRCPPLADLTRDLLLRGVAHRLQEQAFGGLSAAAVRQLAAVATPRASGGPGAVPRTRKVGAARLKPGTVLVRGWHGETHTVTVQEVGFEHRGRHYASLSVIAGEITGAHWSGPRFFGLAGKGRLPRTRSVRAGQGEGAGG